MMRRPRSPLPCPQGSEFTNAFGVREDRGRYQSRVRALRGVAVGRKNHYESRSKRGTRVAALLHSLIESAKFAGAEPRAYLGEAARRAIRNPGTVTLARDLK